MQYKATQKKLKLLDQASPDTRWLIDQAWKDGREQGRAQAPVFNYSAIKLHIPTSITRTKVQKAIKLPFKILNAISIAFGYLLLATLLPFWLPIQMVHMAFQAINWAYDNPGESSANHSWIIVFGNSVEPTDRYFTYWLEKTFPKE